MKWNKNKDTFELTRKELGTLLDTLTFPNIYKKLDKTTKKLVEKLDELMAKYSKNMDLAIIVQALPLVLVTPNKARYNGKTIDWMELKV